MKIAALIPVRGGSKSLKFKNIYPLNGKPLLYYSVKSASEICDDIFISSDSEKILDLAKKFDCKTIKRPDSISDDFSSTEVVLEHAAVEMDMVKKYDAVVYLSACEPLRPKGTLKKLLNEFINKNKAIESLFYGRPTHRHYWLLDPNLSKDPIMKWMKTYTPRQTSLQKLLLECTGYGLITHPKFWKEGKRFGGKCDWLEIPDSIPEVDIHTKIDIDIIESLVKTYQNLLP